MESAPTNKKIFSDLAPPEDDYFKHPDLNGRGGCILRSRVITIGNAALNASHLYVAESSKKPQVKLSLFDSRHQAGVVKLCQVIRRPRRAEVADGRRNKLVKAK
jgi:hypothetical protein